MSVFYLIDGSMLLLHVLLSLLAAFLLNALVESQVLVGV